MGNPIYIFLAIFLEAGFQVLKRKTKIMKTRFNKPIVIFEFVVLFVLLNLVIDSTPPVVQYIIMGLLAFFLIANAGAGLRKRNTKIKELQAHISELEKIARLDSKTAKHIRYVTHGELEREVTSLTNKMDRVLYLVEKMEKKVR